MFHQARTSSPSPRSHLPPSSESCPYPFLTCARPLTPPFPLPAPRPSKPPPPPSYLPSAPATSHTYSCFRESEGLTCDWGRGGSEDAKEPAVAGDPTGWQRATGLKPHWLGQSSACGPTRPASSRWLASRASSRGPTLRPASSRGPSSREPTLRPASSRRLALFSGARPSQACFSRARPPLVARPACLRLGGMEGGWRLGGKVCGRGARATWCGLHLVGGGASSALHSLVWAGLPPHPQ